MKERARELKSAARRPRTAKGDEESAVLEKIAEMQEPDRVMAERIHAVVRASAPELAPPALVRHARVRPQRQIVCFFQPAQKFKTWYATLGFNDEAALDEGTMWPTAYALTK